MKRTSKVFEGLEDFFLDQQERVRQRLETRVRAYTKKLELEGYDRKSRLALELNATEADGWQQMGHSTGKRKEAR